MMRRPLTRRLGTTVTVAALLASATLLGSAAAASTDPPDSEPGATTATSESADASDGVLRIGVLLPQTGEGNWIGLPGIANAEYAARRKALAARYSLPMQWRGWRKIRLITQ